MPAKRGTKRAVAEKDRKVKNLRPRVVSADPARSVKGGVHGGWDTLANKKY